MVRIHAGEPHLGAENALPDEIRGYSMNPAVQAQRNGAGGHRDLVLRVGRLESRRALLTCDAERVLARF